MIQQNSSNILKLVTVTHSWNEHDTLVTNIDGTILSVFNARIIRALSQGLGVPFEIVMPEDNSFGVKESDGTWSGMTGMLARGEADLSVSGFTATQDRREVINFAFPLYVTDVSFMTNKPEPYPKMFAIFRVFSVEIWICIGICLLLISLILYTLLKGKQPYSVILLDTVGSLLEKSYSFDARQKNIVPLLITWLLCFLILTTSYKAVMLSIITFPRMIGIRGISDLSKAAKDGSVKCMSYRGGLSYAIFSESNDDRLRLIGENLKESILEGLHGEEAFFKYPYKKAFISDRVDLVTYKKDFFVSSESFSLSHLAIAYSKKFCCPRELDRVVHRIIEADLYGKTMRDREYVSHIHMSLRKKGNDDMTHIASLTLEDFSGAFLVLFIGYLLSLFVCIVELSVKNNYCKNGKNDIFLKELNDLTMSA